MNKIVSYDFSENYIEKLAQLIQRQYSSGDVDLSRLAVVFGGKRPSLFLKRELSRDIGMEFLSPRFFSIDEFVDYVVSKHGHSKKISSLNASFLIYRLAKKVAPDILKGRTSFSKFLPWAREILTFIEQLDLEDVPSQSLKEVQAMAVIGYEVPQNINDLLLKIISLREAYHKELLAQKTYSRGFQYLRASQLIHSLSFKEFDEVLFCNFFYLHKTEKTIMEDLYKRGKASLVFQGHEDQWPVLKSLSQTLGKPIVPERTRQQHGYHLHLYAGFDEHSQIGIAREILKRVKKKERTVIVLPDPSYAISLLSEISTIAGDFNVSLGYPLKRSSLYSLFELIFKAQQDKKKEGYYTKDYLKVLSHPFVKNLRFVLSPVVTRVLVHKIEEFLIGKEISEISGSHFIKLRDIEQCLDLYRAASDTLEKMRIETSCGDLKELTESLHKLVFSPWEKTKNFEDFCEYLGNFLQTFVSKSPLKNYPLNLQISSRILSLQQEMAHSDFAQEPFEKEEIFKIFLDRLQNEMIAFSGTPLKGLQVLGLLETRALNFENVIILDVNETVLPKLRIYEPLIPREVMLGLNLNRLEKEEEIQRYQFVRLISGAKNVHLIYAQSKDKEKSRFIEDLIWQEQKASNHLKVLEAAQARFQVSVVPKQVKIEKTESVLAFLKKFRFSATSLNTYLNCPLRFYYYYVLGIDEKQSLLDQPEGVDVGEFVHQLLEVTFKRFIGKKPKIDKAFRRYFQKTLDDHFIRVFRKRMKSDSFLLKEVLDVRLRKFLDREEQREVDRILALERSAEGTIDFAQGSFRFAFRIDRVDQMPGGKILIIDYKTGAADSVPKVIKEHFDDSLSRESVKQNIKSFQIPLYFYFLAKEYPIDKLDAAFYHLRTMDMKYFLQRRGGGDAQHMMSYFYDSLDFILKELMDSSVCFKADDRDVRYCGYCPFFYLCR